MRNDEWFYGMRVEHDRYGTGTIVEDEEIEGGNEVTVEFDYHAGGHSGRNARYKNGHCWHILLSELHSKNPIVTNILNDL